MKVKAKVTAIAIWSICMICFMELLRMNVSAEEGIVFHVKNQMGKAGDVVTVPVELHSGEQVGGFDIKVYYDPESMEFQKLQKGELIRDDGLFDYNHKIEKATVKIVFVVSDAVEADGTIANLVFKLKRDCESLPVGINLDEVIDSTEKGNVVTGQVTGTDPAYQEQAERRSAEENAQEQMGQKAEAENSAGEKGRVQEGEMQKKGKQKEEVDLENRGDNFEYDVEESKNVGIAVIVAGAIVAVGFIIWRQSGRKQ